MNIEESLNNLNLIYYKYDSKESILYSEFGSAIASREILIIVDFLKFNKINYTINMDYSISIIID